MASQNEQDDFIAALVASDVGIVRVPEYPHIVICDSILHRDGVLIMACTDNMSTCGLVGKGLLDIVICQRYSGRIPSFESMENAIQRKIDSSILIMEKDEDIEQILAKAPEKKMKKIIFGNYVPKAKELIVLAYKVASGAASILCEIDSIMSEIYFALHHLGKAHISRLETFSLESKEIQKIARHLSTSFKKDESMGVDKVTNMFTLLMINVFCPTTPTQLNVFTSKLVRVVMYEQDIEDTKVLGGSFQSCDNNDDASISLVRITERMLDLLEAPTKAPFWSIGLEGFSGGSAKRYQTNSALPPPSPPPKEPTFSCPLCLGPFVEEVSTKCGHIFCKKCIEAAITPQKRKCPTCRVTLAMNDFLRVYLPTTN